MDTSSLDLRKTTFACALAAAGLLAALCAIAVLAGVTAGVLDLAENHHLLALLRGAERGIAVPLGEILHRTGQSQLKWMVGHAGFVLVGLLIAPKSPVARGDAGLDAGSLATERAPRARGRVRVPTMETRYQPPDPRDPTTRVGRRRRSAAGVARASPLARGEPPVTRVARRGRGLLEWAPSFFTTEVLDECSFAPAPTERDRRDAAARRSAGRLLPGYAL